MFYNSVTLPSEALLVQRRPQTIPLPSLRIEKRQESEKAANDYPHENSPGDQRPASSLLECVLDAAALDPVFCMLEYLERVGVESARALEYLVR